MSRRNRYYLMRHGQSLANLADKIISSPENGLEGYGLSDLGRQQAHENALASGLGPNTVVVASDFLRTRQTAEVVCQALGAAPAVHDARLRERAFGELEDKGGDGYLQVWAGDDADPDHTVLGAESPNALARRLGAVLESLDEAHSGKDILLVSHGDPLRFLQLHAAGRPLTQHLAIRLFTPAEIRALDELPLPEPRL